MNKIVRRKLTKNILWMNLCKTNSLEAWFFVKLIPLPGSKNKLFKVLNVAKITFYHNVSIITTKGTFLNTPCNFHKFYLLKRI